MTAEKALRQAEAERVKLVKAPNNAGCKCVSFGHCISRPYQVKVQHVHLGYFATAEEAALCVARTLEGRAPSKKRRLAEADDGEAGAIMVEAHELMDGDGDGDGR